MQFFESRGEEKVKHFILTNFLLGENKTILTVSQV